MRQWDLVTGDCIRSYPLEISQSRNDNNKNADASLPFKHKSVIQSCKMDPSGRYLLVAFEGGVIQIHNLCSGEIIFNKLAEESLKLDNEVASLAFMGNTSSFWFIAT